MGKVDDYLKSKEKKKYFCLNCFQYTKKKYFLLILQDETGKAYKCPHCKYIWISWALEERFDNEEKRVLEKMKIIK